MDDELQEFWEEHRADFLSHARNKVGGAQAPDLLHTAFVRFAPHFAKGLEEPAHYAMKIITNLATDAWNATKEIPRPLTHADIDNDFQPDLFDVTPSVTGGSLGSVEDEVIEGLFDVQAATTAVDEAASAGLLPADVAPQAMERFVRMAYAMAAGGDLRFGGSEDLSRVLGDVGQAVGLTGNRKSGGLNQTLRRKYSAAFTYVLLRLMGVDVVLGPTTAIQDALFDLHIERVTWLIQQIEKPNGIGGRDRLPALHGHLETLKG